MKNKDFARLAKQLSDLPSLYVKGPMAVLRPVKHVLRGLYFEGSSFDAQSFYLWAFFLPTFVPTKHVILNFGKRLRLPDGSDRWNATEPDLLTRLNEAAKQDALPFLSRIQSTGDMTAALTALTKAQDPYAQQAIAFAWALSRDIGRAEQELKQLLGLLDMKIPWQRDMAERAEILKVKLLADPIEAQEQLKTWEAETLRNLGLENLCD